MSKQPDQEVTLEQVLSCLESVMEAVLTLDRNQDRLCAEMQSLADQLTGVLNPMADRMLGLAQGVDKLTDESQRAIDHFVWREQTS
jgi:hypothetical protein